MNRQTQYSYAEGDLLEKPNTYQYSQYGGREFVLAWQSHRESVQAELGEPISPVEADLTDSRLQELPCELHSLLEDIMADISNGNNMEQLVLKDVLNALVRKFEVTKRLYASYDKDLKAVNKYDYRNLELYLRFAEIVDRAYSNSNNLTFLNVMLKLTDTLIAFRNELKEGQKARLAWLINRERSHIFRCAKNCGVNL